MSDHIDLLLDIDREDLQILYKNLCDRDCLDSTKYELTGNKILDYFFLRHRLATKTKKHISFMEALKDDRLSSKLLIKGRQISSLKGVKLSDKDKIRIQYAAFRLYYGTVNQFRPIIAREIYCIFEPRRGILDFSAGWGGRCLAAMSLGIPYIGFDTNKNLKEPYKNMIKTLDPDAKVKIIFKESEKADFSKYDYDLIFTSPPYYMLETYEDMPYYDSKVDFVQKFFIPVVSNAWKNLSQNGYMVLNMPSEMERDIHSLMGNPTITFELPIRDRHATLSKEYQEQKEYIYVYKKGNQSHKDIVTRWKKLKKSWDKQLLS